MGFWNVIGGAAIVSGVILALVRVLIGRLNTWFSQNDAKDEAREKARRQESIIVMHSIQAIGHLSEAVAIAQKNGHTNGHTDTALDYYAKARDEMNDYLLRQNAAANH